ncbi:hypothetical protein CCP2SC5_40052 [Azospirillaceae bacterium]
MVISASSFRGVAPRTVTAVVLAGVLSFSNVAYGTHISPCEAECDEESLWEIVKNSTLTAVDYTSNALVSSFMWVSGWASASNGYVRLGPELLNSSAKGFRDFEMLVDTAGYRLDGIDYDPVRKINVGLTFGFERHIDDRQRADLRDIIARESGLVGEGVSLIIAVLLEASERAEYVLNKGLKFESVRVQFGSSAEVDLGFRQISPSASDVVTPSPFASVAEEKGAIPVHISVNGVNLAPVAKNSKK